LLLCNQIGVNELGATYSKNWDIRKTNKILVGKTTFASLAYMRLHYNQQLSNSQISKRFSTLESVHYKDSSLMWKPNTGYVTCCVWTHFLVIRSPRVRYASTKVQFTRTHKISKHMIHTLYTKEKQIAVHEYKVPHGMFIAETQKKGIPYKVSQKI